MFASEVSGAVVSNTLLSLEGFSANGADTVFVLKATLPVDGIL